MRTFVLTEIRENIGYIILNREEKRNALNEIFVKELKDALLDWQFNKDIKIVILKSKGQVFSAGADLEYLQKLQKNTFEENLNDSRNLKELYEMIYSYPKVVIAQVEGHAIAGGCGLATICDFCFSIPNAQFGYTEVKIGFIPALVSVFLVKKIGEARSRELLLTGKLISAEYAKSIGMIYEIVSLGKIEETVYEFASKLAHDTSSESIAATKKLLKETIAMSFDLAMDTAAQFNAVARESEDCKKGINAFLKKEKIIW